MRCAAGTLSRLGSVSERPKVRHSKCRVVRATVGSNPTATASREGPETPGQTGFQGFRRSREQLGDTSPGSRTDRKSTRLNSSHVAISYAVFCLKKKKKKSKKKVQII